jgi:ABC-2 type transport system permease protein
VKALTIAANDLRRLFRFRLNVFFLFGLPMLIILLLGSAFGGSDRARIGVAGAAGGQLAGTLTSALDAQPSVRVTRYGSEESLRSAVARGTVEAGLVIPAGYDAAARAARPVKLRFFARPDSIAQQLRATIESVVAGQGGLLGAAGLVHRQRGTPFAEALATATAAAATVPRVSVRLTSPDGTAYPESRSRYSSGASTQLLLFIFLTSLTGAAALIETRRLGVARRMLSTPTAVRTILAGQTMGRLAVALLQALLIVLGSALFFGVRWGDPAGTAAVVVAFALVGAGAGTLIGSVLSNEEQAGPIAILIGLGLAALGGSMVPLEVFPPAVRTAAHLTPHAWGNDAFSTLLRHGGGLGDVLGDVGVLLAFAAVLLALGTWRLRRALTS